MTGYIKDGSIWKEVKTPHIKDGSIWKEVKEGYVKDGTLWKLWHKIAPPPLKQWPATWGFSMRVSTSGHTSHAVNANSVRSFRITEYVSLSGSSTVRFGVDLSMNYGSISVPAPGCVYSTILSTTGSNNPRFGVYCAIRITLPGYVTPSQIYGGYSTAVLTPWWGTEYRDANVHILGTKLTESQLPPIANL